ncbi:DUF3846 domain-containing protein [Bacillus thuringiensis]|nr:DUF3846 domain-containing protein [Bacillus thuringiensis]OUA16709.1 hypothetical protein BK776_30680 [Bacillus thuringiensis serovar aizawai]PES54359.1 DUF3846 domain-containing protein [Bacillus thuringiensis]
MVLMSDTINVLHLEVEKEFIEKEVAKTDLHTLVGGDLKANNLTDTIVLWSNLNAAVLDLRPNVALVSQGKIYEYVRGNIFFTSVDEESGAAKSISEEEIEWILSKYKMTLNVNDTIAKTLVLN